MSDATTVLSPSESALLAKVSEIIFDGLDDKSLAFRMGKVNRVIDLIQAERAAAVRGFAEE